jgi:hypothetical protein
VAVVCLAETAGVGQSNQDQWSPVGAAASVGREKQRPLVSRTPAAHERSGPGVPPATRQRYSPSDRDRSSSRRWSAFKHDRGLTSLFLAQLEM